MTTWEVIAEKAKELPPEKQLEVLDFLEALSKRLEAPLATFDPRLSDAARALGWKVVP